MKLVLGLALVIFQVGSSTGGGQMTTEELNSLVEKAQKKFDELQNYIKESLNSTLKDTSNLKDEVFEKIDKVKIELADKGSIRLLSDIHDKQVERFLCYNELVKKYKTNTLFCGKRMDLYLTDIINEFFENEFTKINFVMRVYNSTYDEVYSFMSEVEPIANGIISCTQMSYLEATKCLASVTANIESLSTRIPKLVASASGAGAKLEMYLSGQRLRYGGLLRDIARMQASVRPFLSKFTKCVAKKLPEDALSQCQSQDHRRNQSY